MHIDGEYYKIKNPNYMKIELAHEMKDKLKVLVRNTKLESMKISRK
jgi:hypothetical protein